MFEVGKEYWITYGTAEEQSGASIKVLAVEGTWLHVESDNLDSRINIAAPMFISAKERNREAEQSAMMKFPTRQIGEDGWPKDD